MYIINKLDEGATLFLMRFEMMIHLLKFDVCVCVCVHTGVYVCACKCVCIVKKVNVYNNKRS